MEWNPRDSYTYDRNGPMSRGPNGGPMVPMGSPKLATRKFRNGSASMYTIPLAPTNDGVLGQTLLSVGVGQHSLVLHFEAAKGTANAMIRIEGDYIIIESGRDTRHEAGSAGIDQRLLKRIGHVVQGWVRVDDLTLDIMFDDSSTLRLLGGSEAYEDFEVNVNGEVVLIV